MSGLPSIAGLQAAAGTAGAGAAMAVNEGSAPGGSSGGGGNGQGQGGGSGGGGAAAGGSVVPTVVPAGEGAAQVGSLTNGIIPKIQNIVATTNLDCKLDLAVIANKARNCDFNPKRFSAVIMRIREPRTTALIFSSGKMVCTGAKSEELAKQASRRFANIIRKLKFNVKFKQFKVQNIVGSCDVKFPIRLERLKYEADFFATYVPESFPGLVFNMPEPKCCLLVFASGKVVLTGAKEKAHILKAFENIFPMLVQCRFDA